MDAKIRIKSASLEFEYEGSQTYIEKNLDHILDKLLKVNQHLPAVNTPHISGGSINDDPGALATFLRNKNATTNQTKKFLATTYWFILKGNKRVSTSDVNKALKENQQSKLGNPSQCLKDNISKGFIEKDSSGFFVTPEGLQSLN